MNVSFSGERRYKKGCLGRIVVNQARAHQFSTTYSKRQNSVAIVLSKSP